jgi:hypothetical protein
MYHQPECLVPIARTIKELLSTYDDASEELQRYQRHTLRHMCRELEKFLIPQISEKAANEALSRAGVDLKTFSSFGWKHQKTKLKDPDRKIFHLEHIIPVTQLANRVLEKRSEGVEDIVEILQTAKIAWILKSEDEDLNRNGYRSVRPDPMTCYKKAKITLITV